MPEVVPEFLASARAFRAALDGDEVDDGTYARRVRNAVARVYLAAALLGPPTTTDGVDPVDVRPRSDESRALRERLKARFGENDVFVEVYDPSRLADQDIKPYERVLSSELVEIDEDIAEAIEWLEASRADAFWDSAGHLRTTGDSTRSLVSVPCTKSPPTASSDRSSAKRSPAPGFGNVP
jgi:hypothetical protein